MNLLAWIIFGGLTGWVASVLSRNNSQQGLLMDIVLGIIGAFVAGLIMPLLGYNGVTGFNLYSFVVAVIGASLVIMAARALRRNT